MKLRLLLLAAVGAATVPFAEQVSAQGIITQWTFQNFGQPPVHVPPYIIHPAPTTGSGLATPLGMNNSYVYPYVPPTVGAQDGEDVIATPGSSTNGTLGANDDAWRIRGQTNAAGPPGSANGWNTAAPQYTQGAEFDVSTVGQQNVVFKYDWFTTNQGVYDQQAQYTVDATHWVNVVTNISDANGLNLATANGFNNDVTIDFASLGITAVNNNPSFGVRLVSAYDPTFHTYIGASGGVYNNTSGNWRFDNVTVSGMAVPEPSSLILAGVASIGLMLYAWRLRRAG